MYIMPTTRAAGIASVGNSGVGIVGGGVQSYPGLFKEWLSVITYPWPALVNTTNTPTIAKIKGIIHRLRFIPYVHLIDFSFRVFR
mgnify:CR=1 FL=1